MTEPARSRLGVADQHVVDQARELAALSPEDVSASSGEAAPEQAYAVVFKRAQVILAELADVASRLARACAWPGCDTYVRPGDICCRPHWYGVPYEYRLGARNALAWISGQPRVS